MLTDILPSFREQPAVTGSPLPALPPPFTNQCQPLPSHLLFLLKLRIAIPPLFTSASSALFPFLSPLPIPAPPFLMNLMGPGQCAILGSLEGVAPTSYNEMSALCDRTLPLLSMLPPKPVTFRVPFPYHLEARNRPRCCWHELERDKSLALAIVLSSLSASAS